MNSSEPDSEDGNTPHSCPLTLSRKRPLFPSCNSEDLQCESIHSRFGSCNVYSKNPDSIEDRRGGKGGLFSNLKGTLCDKIITEVMLFLLSTQKKTE